MSNTLKVSDSLLCEIVYALKSRLRELNNRAPEPTGDSIVHTQAALDKALEALNGAPK